MDNIKTEILIPHEDGTITEFEDSLYEAELLIRHTSMVGKDIPREILDSILNAKQLARQGNLTFENESKFWTAFSKLAKISYPVSVESLKSAHVRSIPNGKSFPQNFRNFFKYSDADLAAIQFRGLAIFVVLLIIVLQIYWLVGVNIIKKIDKLEGRVGTKISKADKNNSNSKDTHSISAKTILEIQQKSLELNTSYEFLYKWNNPVTWVLNIDLSHYLNGAHSEHASDADHSAKDHFVFVAQPADQDLTLKNITIDLARFIIDSLNFFCLPFLYGLMGATAYVLRKLSHDIATVTYTPQSNVEYRLRITLGAMAGMAVVWLFHPSSIVLGDEIQNGSNVFGGIFDALSPLALAFIAGYSVEVMFSVMDTTIAKFSENSSIKKP